MKKYRYKHKKNYRIRKRGLSFLFFIILGAIFYFLIFSSVFQVKEIRVSGNIKVPVEELRNAISDKVHKKIVFFDLKNIFLADLKEVNETLLEKFPQIAKITLNREFPDVLAAQVEERKPVAVFCFTRRSLGEGGQGENYFYIDETGIIFEEVSEIPQMLKIKLSSMPDIELGKKIIEKEKMTQILKINSKLNNLKIPLEEIFIVSDTRFNAKTSDGWEIYFNPEKDLDWQMEELTILLKQRIPPEKRGKLQYIDLRFEKIYIYPENYNW